MLTAVEKTIKILKIWIKGEEKNIMHANIDIVLTNVLGALAASISVVETTCHLIANVILNAIYQATVANDRGATFFVMAAFNGVSFILLL